MKGKKEGWKERREGKRLRGKQRERKEGVVLSGADSHESCVGIKILLFHHQLNLGPRT